jgi:hypothetical protein
MRERGKLTFRHALCRLSENTVHNGFWQPGLHWHGTKNIAEEGGCQLTASQAFRE